VTGIEKNAGWERNLSGRSWKWWDIQAFPVVRYIPPLPRQGRQGWTSSHLTSHPTHHQPQVRLPHPRPREDRLFGRTMQTSSYKDVQIHRVVTLRQRVMLWRYSDLQREVNYMKPESSDFRKTFKQPNLHKSSKILSIML